MSARKLPWLICYDIRDPRRLQRLHRFMGHNAAPVQYSVFIGRYSAADLRWLCIGIERIIDRRVDDVRCYPLPAEPCLTQIGKSRSPDGWSLLAELDFVHTSLPGIGQGWIATQSTPGAQANETLELFDLDQFEPMP